MPKLVTRSVQAALDIAVLMLAFWAAFLFRFEFVIPSTWLRVAITAGPYAVVLEYTVLAVAGITRFSWRYVSMRESVRIAVAMAAATALLLVVGWLHLLLRFDAFAFAFVPRGVVAMNFVLAVVGLISMRAVRRVWGERQERRTRTQSGERARVLLVGAGQAGVMVARELMQRPDLGLVPVGFVDDDRLKLGTQIGGVPVLGNTSQIGEVAAKLEATRALITIANAPRSVIRRIAISAREAGLETKIIPGIYEIVGDHVNLSRIREVAIEDLLGREPITLDEDLISASLLNQVVLVTGAGGSIGSELCRQVCRFAPQKLVLVERFENALFEIHRELIAAFPDVEIAACVADVADAARMEAVLAAHRPYVIYHAAAHKHVPMMEANPGEALKNNIGGTQVVADLATRFGVARFVMISTDKAVNPTSVMGASKRVAEIYTQALAQVSVTRFVTVRFGNVLGSNGSVIPIFKEQIARGGPITVTHPEMRRYFMTIPEASQLVLQAGAMGAGGEVYILDMGEPVKIVDLARDLVTLSGLRPDEDIEIRFSGTRPGEKLFEELSTDAEHADKTKHPKIFIGRVPALAPPVAAQAVRELLALANATDGDQVRKALKVVVPEYTGAPKAVLDDDEDDDAAASARLSASLIAATASASMRAVSAPAAASDRSATERVGKERSGPIATVAARDSSAVMATRQTGSVPRISTATR